MYYESYSEPCNNLLLLWGCQAVMSFCIIIKSLDCIAEKEIKSVENLQLLAANGILPILGVSNHALHRIYNLNNLNNQYEYNKSITKTAKIGLKDHEGFIDVILQPQRGGLFVFQKTSLELCQTFLISEIISNYSPLSPEIQLKVRFFYFCLVSPLQIIENLALPYFHKSPHGELKYEVIDTTTGQIISQEDITSIIVQDNEVGMLDQDGVTQPQDFYYNEYLMAA